VWKPWCKDQGVKTSICKRSKVSKPWGRDQGVVTLICRRN